MKTIFGNKRFQLSSNAFLGIVCAVAIALFLLLFFLLKPSQTVGVTDEIQTLTQNIRAHFQKSMDYRGLNTEFAIKNALVAPTQIRGGKIYSKNRSEILIGRDSSGSAVMPTETFFSLSYLNLDRNVCKKILTSKFEPAIGLVSVKVENEETPAEFTYGGTLGLPVSDENAKKYCGAKNAVVFTFE